MNRWALSVLAICVAGCGGNSPASGAAGSAVLRIRWPEPTRLIPASAASIHVKLSLNGTMVAERVIARPATQASFTGLAYADYTVDADAHPNADGTGVAQAAGAATLRVVDGPAAAITLTLGSTVKNLTLTPSRSSLTRGEPGTITASATDNDGNVVLLSTSAGKDPIAWSSDAPSVVAVSGSDLNGIILGGTSTGTARIGASLRVNDAGDRVSSSVNVPVSGDFVGITAPPVFVTGSTVQSSPTIQKALIDVSVTLAHTVPTSTVVTTASAPSFNIGPSFTIAANTIQTTRTFGVAPVQTFTNNDLTATLNGITTHTNVQVTPNPIADASAPTTIKGGDSATGTATLELYAVGKETFTISSNDTDLIVPSTADVAGPVKPPGSANFIASKTASFSITTRPVTATKTVFVTISRPQTFRLLSITLTP